MEMEWLKELKPEDMLGDLHLVAVHCGIDVALKLAEKMGSIRIYIRPLEDHIKGKKREYIIKHFTGNNHKELAIAVGSSEEWVYQVIKEHRQALQIKQRRLFPE